MSAEAAADARPKLTDAEMLARFHGAKRRPPCSDALGLELLAINQEQMTVRAAFTGSPSWVNPMGALQGGFVTAMLDEVMAVAGIVASNVTATVPTLELKVSFLRPCPPGRLEATARVVKWGRQIAFLESELFDPDGRPVARATATATIAAVPKRG